MTSVKSTKSTITCGKPKQVKKVKIISPKDQSKPDIPPEVPEGKLITVEELTNDNNEKPVKKRVSRAKKQPTREELMKMLLDSSNEVKLIIEELKEDEVKVLSMTLKRVPELLKETIKNMEEDKEEIDEKLKELEECIIDENN